MAADRDMFMVSGVRDVLNAFKRVGLLQKCGERI